VLQYVAASISRIAGSWGPVSFAACKNCTDASAIEPFAAKVIAAVGRLRHEPDRFLDVNRGVFHPSGSSQGNSKPVVHIGRLRGQVDALGEFCDSFLEMSIRACQSNSKIDAS